MRFLLAVPLIFGVVACLPDFPELECFGDDECPGRCVDNQCLAVVDAGEDAGVVDGGEVDAGAADQGVARDVGPDAGFSAQLDPSSIDFGAQPLGCAGPTRTVQVQNLWTTVIEVSAVGISGSNADRFSAQVASVPFTVRPGESKPISVGMTANAAGALEALLEVRYQASEPLTARLLGRGEVAPTITETFPIQAGPLDVLLVVDDDANAGALQGRLANLSSSIINGLSGYDWHLGVTTTHTGSGGENGALQGNPRILDPLAPTPAATLSSRLRVGTSGGAATGLEAARLAVTPPMSTGTNQGFLRTGAPLMVVVVSERPDASSMGPVAYANALKAANGAAPMVLNAVMPLSSGCTLPSGGTSTFDARTQTAVAATGGVPSDVCAATWTPALTTPPPVTPTTELRLGYAASSITVRVDGLVQAEGTVWSYRASDATIVFASGQAPRLGSTVEVSYRAGCL